MNVKLAPTANSATIDASLVLSGSKSESNRLLLLQALMGGFTIENLSNSDDVLVMQKALASSDEVIDIHHAGTVMRFLTAYFAFQKNREVILTGSSRMQHRPIAPLVDALRKMGATITYLEKEGFPPLRIKGSQLNSHKVQIAGDISSQFITAILLLAPTFKDGFKIELTGEITSRSYIEMTLALLDQLGFSSNFKEATIFIAPQIEKEKSIFTVESDWSSASYWFSFVALSKIGSKINISHFYKNSLQGDSCLVDLYKNFGVEATFLDNGILEIKKIAVPNCSHFTCNLVSAPDLAQTIALTCLGLGISCELTGLQTLKIKETDRLVALQNELKKLGATIQIDNESIALQPPKKLNQNCIIETYNDHRMALAFAPLSILVPIEIKNAEVVSKSYPDFWNDVQVIMSK